MGMDNNAPLYRPPADDVLCVICRRLNPRTDRSACERCVPPDEGELSLGAKLRRVEAENAAMRDAGGAVLRHLELSQNQGPVNNPAYWAMLADRMRAAGFVAKQDWEDG